MKEIFIAVVSGIVSSLVAAELTGISVKLAKRLMLYSVSRLPDDYKERFEEEWEALLEEASGPFSKIWVAFGFIPASQGLRDDVRKEKISEIEANHIKQNIEEELQSDTLVDMSLYFESIFREGIEPKLLSKEEIHATTGRKVVTLDDITPLKPEDGWIIIEENHNKAYR